MPSGSYNSGSYGSGSYGSGSYYSGSHNSSASHTNPARPPVEYVPAVPRYPAAPSSITSAAPSYHTVDPLRDTPIIRTVEPAPSYSSLPPAAPVTSSRSHHSSHRSHHSDHRSHHSSQSRESGSYSYSGSDERTLVPDTRSQSGSYYSYDGPSTAVPDTRQNGRVSEWTEQAGLATVNEQRAGRLPIRNTPVIGKYGVSTYANGTQVMTKRVDKDPEKKERKSSDPKMSVVRHGDGHLSVVEKRKKRR